MKKWMRWTIAALAVVIICILILTVTQYWSRKQPVYLALEYVNDSGYSVDLDHFEVTVEQEKIKGKDYWKVVFTEIPNEKGEYLGNWKQKYAVFIDMETNALFRVAMYR